MRPHYVYVLKASIIIAVVLLLLHCHRSLYRLPAYSQLLTSKQSIIKPRHASLWWRQDRAKEAGPVVWEPLYIHLSSTYLTFRVRQRRWCVREDVVTERFHQRVYSELRLTSNMANRASQLLSYSLVCSSIEAIRSALLTKNSPTTANLQSLVGTLSIHYMSCADSRPENYVHGNLVAPVRPQNRSSHAMQTYSSTMYTSSYHYGTLQDKKNSIAYDHYHTMTPTL